MKRTLIETYRGWHIHLVEPGCYFVAVNRHAPVWACEGNFLSVAAARDTIEARLDVLATEASDAREAYVNERNNCGPEES